MGNCFQPVESKKNKNSDQIPGNLPPEKKPKNDSDSDSDFEKRNNNQSEDPPKKIDFQPSGDAANKVPID